MEELTALANYGLSETDEALLKRALNTEAGSILNQLAVATEAEQTHDLAYLFNINQNKKTMVRVNKLNDLLDILTDQAIKRFSTKPDNISNQELLQGLKVVQDVIERGQKQVIGQEESPLIQINQQTNEVNVGTPEALNRESREKVKKAVLDILNGLGVDKAVMPCPSEDAVDTIIADDAQI